MNQPALWRDLRVALASLYSLPSSSHGETNNNNSSNNNKSHEFLMDIQSRNQRRKLHSQRQSLRDSSSSRRKKSSNNNLSQASSTSDIRTGSSWLACIAVLYDPSTSNEEKLFCAQTLLHRVKRMKLLEAVDLEMEPPTQGLSNTDSLDGISLYRQWAHELHMGSLVEDIFRQAHQELHGLQQQQQQQQQPGRDAESSVLLGEVAMTTVAAIIYRIASDNITTPKAIGNQHHHHSGSSRIRPLLYTLGATMATLALRMRFTKPTTAHGSSEQGLPMISRVLKCFDRVSALLGAGEALYVSLCAALGALPDTLLATPGGLNCKISIDPRIIQLAYLELWAPPTGALLMWEAIQIDPNHNDGFQQHHPAVFEMLLTACTQWATYLPLPRNFVESTLHLSVRYLQTPRPNRWEQISLCLAYWSALFESGTLTIEEIGASQNREGERERKSKGNRPPKKGHNIPTTSSDNNEDNNKNDRALAEQRHRGETACVGAEIVWRVLDGLVQEALASSPETTMTAAHEPSSFFASLSCLGVCVDACFTHIVRCGESLVSLDAMLWMSKSFGRLCASPIPKLRALTLEPLVSLQQSLLESTTRPTVDDLVKFIVNHLSSCSWSLALSCGYPAAYFDNLGATSDEEVETDRNNVRDVLRAVTAPEGDKQGAPINEVSLQVLANIVEACSTAVESTNPGSLPHETIVHALSALAKPINCLALQHAQDEIPQGAKDILIAAFRTLRLVANTLSEVIPKLPASETLPVSRLLCLAVCSFSPAFARTCEKPNENCRLWREMNELLLSAVPAAGMSAAFIPELAAESVLEHSPYDIVGAMRSPGGEDHVGVLVFMRLSNEGELLKRRIVELHGTKLIQDLIALHDQLKLVEVERGPFVWHGRGVTPRARRILLESISTLATTVVEQLGTSIDDTLNQHFNSLAAEVASANVAQATGAKLLQMCELLLDLASFSRQKVHVLMEVTANATDSLQYSFCKVLFDAGLLGFVRADSANVESLIQWGRLRGALVNLVSVSAAPDISKSTGDLLVAWINAECEAIVRHCCSTPNGMSPVFDEGIISSDAIPAGAHLVALGRILDAAPPETEALPNCLRVVQESSVAVLRTILLERAGDPPLGDPRPTLIEAWYALMTALAKRSNRVSIHALADILTRSCCAGLCLILRNAIPVEDNTDIGDGMMMDGPQTLALLDFLTHFISLGSTVFSRVGEELGAKLRLSSDVGPGNSAVLGAAAIAASLLRAASGSLPPWTIEDIPKVVASLYGACGGQMSSFEPVLQQSLCLRLDRSAAPFGFLQPGELLAGVFLEKMPPQAKDEFLRSFLESCGRNDWRRVKALTKQACGGKKKAVAFKLKPSKTRWEFDRL